MARSAGARSRARSFGGARFTGGAGSDEASWSPGLLDEWDGPVAGVSGADDTSGAVGARGASEVEDETWLLGDQSEFVSAEASQLHLLGVTESRSSGAPLREPSDEFEGGEDAVAREPHDVEDTPPQRRRKPRIIERGPTRADVTLDAWCSFCCRPRAEIGELVAGPAGAFICKACLTASSALFGDSVSPVSLPARPHVETPTPSAPDFIGQPEARSALIDALRTGVRCVLLIGAEGCGKSTLLQMLQREGQGALTTVDALTGTPSSTPLFIEDVDQLSTEHQRALSAFLGRASRPTVVLSARGNAPSSSKLALRGEGLRLNIPTTGALSRAMRDTVTVSILEHVQHLVSLRPPTSAEYKDMARARLAAREHATALSEKALSVLVAEAARSPRAGHELQALLQRIPPGTWDLDKVTKPAPARKGRRKKGTS
nr:ClpX C4-type zinc finger protein [Myxococcus fulvus]